jgi:hypothetical protein
VIGQLVHAWSDHGGVDGEGPGFVTVMRTADMPASAVRMAVSCSGHRVGLDERPTIAMRRFETVEGAFMVLSSTCPVELESGPSRIAHHWILDERAARLHDPAALLDAWRPMSAWSGDVKAIPAPPDASDPIGARRCEGWQSAAGDAGWAGDVIDRVRSLEGSTLVVRLPNAIDALALVIELAALLPPEERRRLTFADRLRRRDEVALVLLDDSAAAIAEAPLPGGAALLDLTERSAASNGALAEAARAGSTIEPATPRQAPVLGDTEPERVEDSDRAWSGPIEVTLASPTSPRQATAVVLVAIAIAGAAAIVWLVWSSLAAPAEALP